MTIRTPAVMLAVAASLGTSAVAAPEAGARPLIIVTGNSPSSAVRHGVDDLVAYLERMGNPRPSVAAGAGSGDIYVGVLPPRVAPATRAAIQARLQGKDADAFVLRSDGTSLIIAGNSDRAVLYGAYDYLESLGVRWYLPGADNEVVPRRQAVTTGYDVVRIPSFRKRGVVTFTHRVLWTIHDENYEQPGFREFVKFAARRKLNTIAVHHEHSFAQAAKVIAEFGLTPEQEVHFFGDRFCPDDQSSLKHETSRFSQYLDGAPTAMQKFFLWPDDENLPACPSPEYGDWRVSDLTLNFSNEMARVLRQRRPEATFAFISYLRTWEPPRHVKPAAGVALEWAPMNQSFAVSLDDERSAANTRLRRQFESYLRIFSPEDTQVLGYWLDDTLFSRTGLGNFPYRPTALHNDLRYYRRSGVRDVTTFGVFSMWDTFYSKAPPAVFLYPDLLWDLSLDTNQAMQDFCDRYFGNSRTFVVFKALEEMDGIVNIEDHHLAVDHNRIDDFNRLLGNAIKLATELMEQSSDPLQRSRMAKLLVEVASRANYRTR